jgi:hypothetical protein
VFSTPAQAIQRKIQVGECRRTLPAISSFLKYNCMVLSIVEYDKRNVQLTANQNPASRHTTHYSNKNLDVQPTHYSKKKTLPLRVTRCSRKHAAAGTAQAGPQRSTTCPSMGTARNTCSCSSRTSRWCNHLSQSEASVQALRMRLRLPLAAPYPAPPSQRCWKLAPQLFSWSGVTVSKLLLEVQPHAASLSVRFPPPFPASRFGSCWKYIYIYIYIYNCLRSGQSADSKEHLIKRVLLVSGDTQSIRSCSDAELSAASTEAI